ncbi:MAG: Ig-like domain-containing protein [Gemmatimonadota bacterium]|nr:Ig-like domain-containing protein [Gemmatimonadota bacterium]
MRTLLLLAALVLACGGAADQSDPTPEPVAISISPPSDTVLEDGSIQLTALVTDSRGRPLPDPVTWWTLDSLHAVVDGNGRVTGLNMGRGTAIIRGLVGALVDSSRITVLPRPVANIMVSGPSTLLAADFGQATAILLDSLNRVLDLRPVTWASTDPTVLQVGTDGTLIALKAGTAGIRVTSENVTVESGLTVQELQFDSLWAGEGHTCGLETSGKLWCWGSNFAGALGESPVVTPSRPVPVQLGTWSFVQVSTGGGHSCGLLGDSRLFCWGSNDHGELGSGPLGLISLPREVVGAPAFARISMGARHSCGLTAAGVAYCWGHNNLGQLGVGDSVNRITPTPVATGLQFTGLAAGGEHTCAIAIGGGVYCWGSRWHEEIVPDTNEVCRNLEACLVPAAIEASPPVVELSAKVFTTCGRATGPGLWCWGPGWSLLPMLVGGDRTFLRVSAGSGWVCGIATDAQSYCYSQYDTAPLGRPISNSEPGLASVPITGNPLYTVVASGYGFACGIARGVVSCWGTNQGHELGNWGLSSSVVPIPIIGHPH